MKIAILSRNPRLYSTKRIVEAGEKRGHEMVVLDHLKCDILIEKKKPQLYYKGELIEGFDAIIPRIG
ncbi:MAG TPA: 30S ribosomal protein S6--L-glutamate ligase, partial [Bacteroidetes bacterium]|nr:30S ribosomal protein S6--L-glutamate ligase [Bacteroidota bacterium]